jgi:hypothetical protein
MWVALAVLSAALLGGCPSREHIREDYGQKTRGFFAAQHVHEDADTDQPTGLDSEEAAAIHGRYRKDIGGTARDLSQDSPSRVLIVQEDEKGGRK